AVELGVNLRARRERHPGLLGRREDMGIGRWALARIVHGADADEAHRGARARIVAPDRDLAVRATRNALALAAGRGRVDDLRLGDEMLDPVELVQRIKRVHGAGLALAPGAVAGMHDHRLAVQPIANVSAGAAAFHRSLLVFSGSHIAEQEAGDLALLD